MKKVTYILLALITVAVFACNKNQKVVKELEGDWKQTGEKVNGVAVPDSMLSTGTMHFEKCKVKKGDCDGNVSEDGKSIPFTYNITEDGTKFTMSVNFGGVVTSSTAEIVEHSKTKFVYKSTDGGDVTETTLEKK